MCALLSDSSLQQAVFVKDMAYHANPFILDNQILSAKHTFLISSPNLSIPSLLKMRENFHEDETGFAGQRCLYSRIHQLTGKRPFIVDAEQRITFPSEAVSRYFDYLNYPMAKDALTWQPGSRDEWKGRESWHTDAINSKGFINQTNTTTTEK